MDERPLNEHHETQCPSNANGGPMFWRRLLFASLVLGVVFRARTVIFDRSLWLDELFLWKALGTPEPLGAFRPLAEGQVAAPGYVFLVQSLRLWFQDAEWVLRLPSLLASLFALPLILTCSKQVLSPAGRTVVVALLWLAASSIYYSYEFKPYALDVAVAVALMLRYAAVAEGRAKFHAVQDGAIAILATFSSLPACFTIASGFSLLAFRASKERDVRAMTHIVVAALVSAAYFVFQYSVALSHHRDDPNLHQYWIDLGAFPTVDPGVRGIATFIASGLFRALSDPVGLGDAWGRATISTVLGCALFVVGIGRVREPRHQLALVTIGVTLLAASLRFYPFSGRVLLFLVPSLLLCIGIGFDTLSRLLAQKLRWATPIVALTLLAPSVVIGVIRLGRPLEREEAREVVAAILHGSESCDAIYLTRFGRYSFDYYRRDWRNELPTLIDAAWVNGASDQQYASTVAAKVRDHRRIWVFGTHFSADENAFEFAIDTLSRMGGTIVRRVDRVGARAALFEMSDSPR